MFEAQDSPVDKGRKLEGGDRRVFLGTVVQHNNLNKKGTSERLEQRTDLT